MPRFLISSAISRLVHWLIGRPESSGFSQAIASIWQRWSAVIRAGAPGRGRSSSRSATVKSSNETGCNVNHRSRHCRTVSTVIPNSLAIWALFLPSAAARTIRPRRAICCDVLCRLTNCSRPCRSLSVTLTAGGFGPLMIVTQPSQDGNIITDLSSIVKPKIYLSQSALAIPTPFSLQGRRGGDEGGPSGFPLSRE